MTGWPDWAVALRNVALVIGALWLLRRFTFNTRDNVASFLWSLLIATPFVLILALYSEGVNFQ
jgi:hypothetical protein